MAKSLVRAVELDRLAEHGVAETPKRFMVPVSGGERFRFCVASPDFDDVGVNEISDLRWKAIPPDGKGVRWSGVVKIGEKPLVVRAWCGSAREDLPWFWVAQTGGKE